MFRFLFSILLFSHLHHFGVIAPEVKIWVTGHRGLVGSAAVRRLNAAGYHNMIVRTQEQLHPMRYGGCPGFF